MRLAYIGNFEPRHSTENEVFKGALDAGHEITAWQENTRDTWERLPDEAYMHDLVLWTRTGWDWPHATGWDWETATAHQRVLLAACREAGVPVVGFHLDRWWGLDREGQVRSEPFFEADLLCTADGGHTADWADAGVNHRWLPPAVSRFECEPAAPSRRYASDVAFVGSWRPGYHHEWSHRPELVAWLRRTYGGRCRFWPRERGHAVRGAELRTLYASTKVNVGDSCLAGGATRYWSDRIPETLGRGGFLLHPYVEGIEEHFTDGEHLRLWPLGDWGELRRLVDYYLEHDDERRRIAAAGRAHVLAHHTYTVRVGQVLDLACKADLVCEEWMAA
jgi:hypothetical protein